MVWTVELTLTIFIFKKLKVIILIPAHDYRYVYAQNWVYCEVNKVCNLLVYVSYAITIVIGVHHTI
jgi:hypothetical protein